MREKGSIEAIRKTIEEIEEFLGETPFTKEMKERLSKPREERLSKINRLRRRIKLVALSLTIT